MHTTTQMSVGPMACEQFVAKNVYISKHCKNKKSKWASYGFSLQQVTQTLQGKLWTLKENLLYKKESALTFLKRKEKKYAT